MFSLFSLSSSIASQEASQSDGDQGGKKKEKKKKKKKKRKKKGHANRLPNDIAQPQTGKWLSSSSHFFLRFSPFNCCLSVVL